VSRPHPYERFDIGQFSPDGSLFAYVEENPVIVDLSTNTETDIRPDGRSYFSLDGGEVYWSADSEWILLAEEALIAGGGAPRWTSIVKRDGSMRRELGQNGSPTTVGWLPDNVDVAQLSALQTSPLFPTPTATIHTPDWSFALSWSPDGTQIARGAVNLGGVLGPSTLHDVTTGDHLADLDPMNFEFNRVAWTQNDDGSYSPQIIEQPVPSGNFGSVIFATSPDGSLSAEYGTDEGDEIAIYDVATGEMLHSEYRLGMAAVSFTSDNSLVIISSPYARAILYDGETWEPILTFNTHATALAFSPDGQTLALANSWDIDLYAVDELLPSTD
jgi:WD40 repeat protein